MPEKKGKDMTKFIMHGCNGAMGQVITRLAKEDPEVEIVAGIDINDRIDNGYPVFTNIQDCTVEADVIVDFSVAKAVDSVIDFAVFKLAAIGAQVLAQAGYDIEIVEKHHNL